MKIWKQCAFIGFLAVIVFALAFTACDGGNDDPKLCTCLEKAHLEVGQSCDCGGTDCNCTEKETPTARSEGTYRTLVFIYDDTPAEGTFSVTVKSNDQYLNADWNAIVNQVVTALENSYNNTVPPPARVIFENVFGDGANVFLVNDLANDWEVKDGEFRTLYLKTGSIDTANYVTATARMGSNYPDVGN